MPPRSGTLPPALLEAYEAGTFALTGTRVSRDPQPELVRQAQQVWNLPIIMLSFANDTLVYGGATFEHALFDSTGSTPTGSLYDYFQWTSGGLITVTGRVVATVRLPETREYYAGTSGGLGGTTPYNDLGLVREALRQCANSVNWAPYDVNRDGDVDMVWFIHAGIGGEATSDPTYLWSVTSRMSGSWTQAGVWETETPYTTTGGISTYLVVDRFTILPELSPFVPGNPSEIGVYCHEFGHALGLPDLFDTSVSGVGNSGTGHWSLMGSGGYGGNGSSPQYPTHLCAWSMRYLGLDRSIRPENDTTLVLGPLAETRKIVDWWFQGENSDEHFLIENRHRSGFDRNLPNDGLIVYHVNEAVIASRIASNRINSGLIPGLQIVEADGDYDLYTGRNRGDRDDPFPGGRAVSRLDDWTTPDTRTFLGRRTDISLRDIVQMGSDVQVRIRVRSPGWLEPEVQSGSPYVPTNLAGSGRASVVDADGNPWQVATEIVNGRPQIVLRGGHGALTDFTQVSQTTGQAYDPTLATIPGGNLAVVWCDTRDGRPELYYRSRVFGHWSAERKLTALPGDCTGPAMVSDETGTLTVAFNYMVDDRSQVRLMRFTYFSPFGQSLPITDFFAFEMPPSLFHTPTGSAMVTWVDKAVTPQRIMFARHHPDSGVTQPLPLTRPSRYPQASPVGVLDRDGAMHFAWLTVGPALSEIHYQRRPFGVEIDPMDLVLESRGEPMSGVALESGPERDLHLAFEATRSGITQIRYRRYAPTDGWDLMSTEVTRTADGTAKRPVVFPQPDGDVSIAYALYPAGADPRLMLRRRRIAADSETPTTSVPQIAGPAMRIGPNPLRSGTPLRIEWAAGAAPPGPVEVFDLAGRRIASLPWRSTGSGWRAGAEGALTRGWTSGVYFARAGTAGMSARIVVIR